MNNISEWLLSKIRSLHVPDGTRHRRHNTKGIIVFCQCLGVMRYCVMLLLLCFLSSVSGTLSKSPKIQEMETKGSDG